MTRIKPSLAGAILAAFVLSGTAAAENPITLHEQGDVPTASVSFGDLSLAGEAGRAVLNARVRIAAEQLCREGATVEPLDVITARQRCFYDALANARPRVEQAIAGLGSGERQIVVALRR
ncbi:MAG: UrcA family protein [Sphingomonadales bacterium]